MQGGMSIIFVCFFTPTRWRLYMGVATRHMRVLVFKAYFSENLLVSLQTTML